MGRRPIGSIRRRRRRWALLLPSFLLPLLRFSSIVSDPSSSSPFVVAAAAASVVVPSSEGDEGECVNGTCLSWTQIRSSDRTKEGGGCNCGTSFGGGGARIAYLISVHNERTITDALHLFRSIRSDHTIIVVHVDKKVNFTSTYGNSDLAREIENYPCGSSVHVDSIHDSEWGTWSMNGPTHWGMDVLVSNPRFKYRWDVFINLSGDTMPVYTPRRMKQLFDPNGGPLCGINFVTASSCVTGLIPTNVYHFPKGWHKREAYTTWAESKFVIEHVDRASGEERETKLIPHFGSQWMALTPDFVAYVVEELKREDSLVHRFKEELIKTKVLMTDETFIPTLLMHVKPFNETLPKVSEDDGRLLSLPSMSSIRYERMDENYPDAFGYFPVNQRYDVPPSNPRVTQPKVWGPYYLGVYDLANVKRSGALFVRKVSVDVDPNLVNLLPVSDVNDLPSIDWPPGEDGEILLTAKPDWEKTKAMLIAKAKRKKGKEERDRKEKARAEKEIEKRRLEKRTGNDG